MQNILVQQKIKALEEEVKQLKNLLKEEKVKKKKVAKQNKKRDSLYGILKGVKISWKEFQEAKKIWHHSESHVK